MAYRDGYTPIGQLTYFANANGDAYITSGNAVFLKCDGSVYSQSTYPSLFSVLGHINPIAGNWTVQSTGTTSNILSATYGNGVYVIGLNAGGTQGIFSSTDAVTWTARATIGLAAQTFTALTYGNGLYIAAGSAGLTMTSTDATSWNVRLPFAGAGSVQIGAGPGVIFANSTYVTCGTVGNLCSSSNETTWTARYSGTTSTIRSLVYGTKYVFSTNGGGISTSDNLITWTSRSSGTASNINGLAYGVSTYCYVGNGGIIGSSADAITWANPTSGTTSTLYGVIFGGGLFVNCGVGASLSVSTDANTWVAKTSNAATTIMGLIYGSAATNPYVYFCSNGHVGSSTDATTWVAQTSNTSSTLYCGAYNGSVFVAAGTGGAIISSTDGITWAARTSGTTSSILTMTANGSTFYGGGGSTSISQNFQLTSTDGTTWSVTTILPLGSTNNVSLTFGNNLYILGDNSGGIFTSSNGTVWTSRTSGTGAPIAGLTYANGKYVYVVQGGTGVSLDGITWALNTQAGGNAITYGSNVFMVAGNAVGSTNNGSVDYSSDGLNWSVGISGTLSTIFSLAYLGGVFVYGAAGGKAAYSSSGASWTNITTSTTGSITAATAGGNLFVIAGGGGALLTSSTTYIYNPSTQFQVPTDANLGITVEPISNFKRSLYIKAT